MENLEHYKKETRPWGNFERFTLNEKSTVKMVTVNAGEAFSLQTHEHRNEFWYALTGRGMVTVGDKTREANAGDSFFIKAQTPHRVECKDEHFIFLEIAFGDFDENDITRLEDKYGRS
ncbi:MAG: phosphomannose isomerase type II C-terminal cupin domain [Patescibacteria group bacterium]|nr:phosphomannose isomerase type II C-terminal cupin domain [Patescibacteria group bacterium]